MSCYEDNLQTLKSKAPLIAEKMDKYPFTGRVFKEDALIEGCYMVMEWEGQYIPLQSIYSPAYCVSRFCMQFDNIPNEAALMLLGFGDGSVVRTLLKRKGTDFLIIVYEPSADIFFSILQEYDIRDILDSQQIHIIIGGINDDSVDRLLDECITHTSWKYFYWKALPVYIDLFPQEALICKDWYDTCISNKKADVESAVIFAKQSMYNEIISQKWLIKGHSINSLINCIPKGSSCIVVAAGPSLEKNIVDLKNAVGRACIISVDSAVSYLVRKGIIPDFICTVDAMKTVEGLDHDCLKGVPILVSTISNFQMLANADALVTVFFHTQNEYYKKITQKHGCQWLDIDYGGSVATVSFALADALGFETIIIVGQDLAYTNMQSHAGKGMVTEEEKNRYTMYEVEGYYGDTVITSGDFKLYIDWYNRIIPQIASEKNIINSTEGGAKLRNAEQMPLKQAIQKYCTTECDYKELFKKNPCIWETTEDKKDFYYDMKAGIDMLRQIRHYAQDGEKLIDQLRNYRKSSVDFRKLEEIEKQIDTIYKRISDMELYRMLTRRIIDNYIMTVEGIEKNNKSGGNKQMLYHLIYNHLIELEKVAAEAIDIWHMSMVEINQMYRFE